MMYAVSTATLVVAIAYPAMNAVMSRQIPANEQGELQGAVTSVYSLSSIIGPPLMTEVFSYFSGGSAPVHFPGAAFVVASVLTMIAGVVYARTTHAPAAQPDAARAR